MSRALRGLNLLQMRSKPSQLLFISRLLSSSSSSLSTLTLVSPPKLKNISYRHRPRARKEAKLALIEYLHLTRCLPFSLAEHIASNSPFSLSYLLSQVTFPSSAFPSHFPRILRSFLSYRPINEFDFFFESIGISPNPSLDPHTTDQTPSLFLNDDPLLLSAVSSLVHFGFPCSKLGLLCLHDASIFRQDTDALVDRLRSLEALGFRRVCVIAICLVFPWVLLKGEQVDLLFRDLRTVYVEFGLDGLVGDDVERVCEVCRRIRVFYDAGAEMGTMGELMGMNKRIFLDMDERELAQKLNFFLKLGMGKEEAGMYVLKCNETLDLDLETPGIAMPEYLLRVGFNEEEVGQLSLKYPYVMGKNKLGNLPGILRAMDLHEWFLNKIVKGNVEFLMPKYACIKSYDEKVEEEFLEGMGRVKSVKSNLHVDNKLEFLFSIGFGKNKITSKAVLLINSRPDMLQARFDRLIEVGISYSTLCRMISATPKLLNQSTEQIHEKVNYLLNDLKYPLEYLDNFPAFLCFDLENRIKPRYKIMNWLQGKGLLKRHFSPATVLATAEKKFIRNLYGIHPAAPKLWLEFFSSRIDFQGNQRNLFAPEQLKSSI